MPAGGGDGDRPFDRLLIEDLGEDNVDVDSFQQRLAGEEPDGLGQFGSGHKAAVGLSYRSGKQAFTRTPAFGPFSTHTSPPTAEARSLIPRIPSAWCSCSVFASAPMPLSSTRNSSWSSDTLRRMSQREARACRATFVMAS